MLPKTQSAKPFAQSSKLVVTQAYLATERLCVVGCSRQFAIIVRSLGDGRAGSVRHQQWRRRFRGRRIPKVRPTKWAACSLLKNALTSSGGAGLPIELEPRNQGFPAQEDLRGAVVDLPDEAKETVSAILHGATWAEAASDVEQFTGRKINPDTLRRRFETDWRLRLRNRLKEYDPDFA